MATHAPGFINVRSRVFGDVSLSIAHITGIRSSDTGCTIYMNFGDPVIVNVTRDNILIAISEAAGAVGIGTAAELDQITAGIQANTQALVAAVQQNRVP